MKSLGSWGLDYPGKLLPDSPFAETDFTSIGIVKIKWDSNYKIKSVSSLPANRWKNSFHRKLRNNVDFTPITGPKMHNEQNCVDEDK